MSDESLKDKVDIVREELSAALSSRKRRVKDLFAAWDQDGNGTVDAVEFYHALLTLGIDLNGQEARAVFTSLDADGSGTIDYRELHDALRPSVELEAILQPGALGTIEVESRNAIALRTDGTSETSSHVLGGVDLAGAALESEHFAHTLRQLLAERWTRVRDLVSGTARLKLSD